MKFLKVKPNFLLVEKAEKHYFPTLNVGLGVGKVVTGDEGIGLFVVYDYCIIISPELRIVDKDNILFWIDNEVKKNQETKN